MTRAGVSATDIQTAFGVLAATARRPHSSISTYKSSSPRELSVHPPVRRATDAFHRRRFKN